MPQKPARMVLSTADATQRYRLFTLLALLTLQCSIYAIHLSLLPMWGDEAFTVETAAQTPARIVQIATADIHPPLYFLLAHWWNKIPISSDPLVRLRALSVIFAILTTVLLDRLWLRKAPTTLRNWFLLFWILSPCLLLYGRMARSYSMQIFFTVGVVWYLLRWVESSEDWKDLVGLVAALVALLYTHYLPGIVLWAGANLFLLLQLRGYRLRVRTWLLPNLLVAVLSLPWGIMLIPALVQWQRSQAYRLTGNVWAEQLVKLGYSFYSFVFGESVPIWLLPLTLLLALPCFWLLVSGAWIRRDWFWPAIFATAFAFLGATRWVSYAFMGARLLFLLPLFLLALSAGVTAKGGPWRVLAVILVGANLVGVWTYYGAEDLLNAGYLVPSQAIANQIASHSNSRDTVVWVDELNFDGSALEYYLPRSFRIRWLTSTESVEEARSELSAGGIHHVWFLRSSHDNSPGHMFEQLESQMIATWSEDARYPYVPLSPVQLAIRRAVARLHHYDGDQPPRYVCEVWEFKASSK